MIYLICISLIIIFIYTLITLNNLIKLNNKVNEAFSTIDIYLKKRWELIPSIVNTIKEYTKYEDDTLKSVLSIKTTNYDDMNINNKINTNNKLDNSINKIFILKEECPNLKSSDNYINLSRQLTKLEDEIARSRKYYNANARVYNNKVEMFPSNIIAKIFGYKKIEMFNIDDKENENIDMEVL